eukprot:COSAG04_NODE_1384_length_6988_cov_5.001161_1_plen_1277_part_00
MVLKLNEAGEPVLPQAQPPGTSFPFESPDLEPNVVATCQPRRKALRSVLPLGDPDDKEKTVWECPRAENPPGSTYLRPCESASNAQETEHLAASARAKRTRLRKQTARREAAENAAGVRAGFVVDAGDEPFMEELDGRVFRQTPGEARGYDEEDFPLYRSTEDGPDGRVRVELRFDDALSEWRFVGTDPGAEEPQILARSARDNRLESSPDAVLLGPKLGEGQEMGERVGGGWSCLNERGQWVERPQMRLVRYTTKSWACANQQAVLMGTKPDKKGREGVTLAIKAGNRMLVTEQERLESSVGDLGVMVSAFGEGYSARESRRIDLSDEFGAVRFEHLDKLTKRCQDIKELFLPKGRDGSAFRLEPAELQVLQHRFPDANCIQLGCELDPKSYDDMLAKYELPDQELERLLRPVMPEGIPRKPQPGPGPEPEPEPEPANSWEPEPEPEPEPAHYQEPKTEQQPEPEPEPEPQGLARDPAAVFQELSEPAQQLPSEPEPPLRESAVEQIQRLKTRIKLATDSSDYDGIAPLVEQIKRLELSAADTGCRVLDLSELSLLTDTGLAEIANACPNTRAIFVGADTKVTQDGLRVFHERCSEAGVAELSPQVLVLGSEVTRTALLRLLQQFHDTKTMDLSESLGRADSYDQITGAGLQELIDVCPDISELRVAFCTRENRVKMGALPDIYLSDVLVGLDEALADGDERVAKLHKDAVESRATHTMLRQSRLASEEQLHDLLQRVEQAERKLKEKLDDRASIAFFDSISRQMGASTAIFVEIRTRDPKPAFLHFAARDSAKRAIEDLHSLQDDLRYPDSETAAQPEETCRRRNEAREDLIAKADAFAGAVELIRTCLDEMAELGSTLRDRVAESWAHLEEDASRVCALADHCRYVDVTLESVQTELKELKDKEEEMRIKEDEHTAKKMLADADAKREERNGDQSPGRDLEQQRAERVGVEADLAEVQQKLQECSEQVAEQTQKLVWTFVYSSSQLEVAPEYLRVCGFPELVRQNDDVRNHDWWLSRTFANSNFKAAYDRAEAPKDQMELGAALVSFIQAYCEKERIPWGGGEGEDFFTRLRAEAMENADDPVEEMVQRMWTSTLQLGGKEFCFIINDGVRADEKESTSQLAKVARGINKLCVSVPPNPPFPPDDTCYRGGGFDDRYRGFFAPGQRFRQPAYLATSFSRDKADLFIGRSDMPKKVLWIVRIHPRDRCRHVNLVTKRVPGLENEQEYLFAPYSVFKVARVKWGAGTNADPYEIELHAAVDNMEEPLDLPLAPWS